MKIFLPIRFESMFNVNIWQMCVNESLSLLITSISIIYITNIMPFIIYDKKINISNTILQQIFALDLQRVIFSAIWCWMITHHCCSVCADISDFGQYCFSIITVYYIFNVKIQFMNFSLWPFGTWRFASTMREVDKSCSFANNGEWTI